MFDDFINRDGKVDPLWAHVAFMSVFGLALGFALNTTALLEAIILGAIVGVIGGTLSHEADHSLNAEVMEVENRPCSFRSVILMTVWVCCLLFVSAMLTRHLLAAIRFL